IRIMEQMLQTSESKYKEQIESFKKMESEQNEKEEIQRRRMTEEFTSNVQSLRQEYETKISNLQQDLELAKKEWTAETEAQIKVLQSELKESQDGSASLREEMARQSVHHEAELRDLEEQLEVNAAHFEMERERLLLLNEELAEQLALKESYLQDVQEEEEDLNRNGAQKTSGPTSTPHSSTEDDPDNDETDGLRLTLHDLQSQNTMVQEELTFLRNVKMELENEVQHLKEEFTMEKEELEFKLNELQMTKEDCSSSGMEIDAQTESDERNTKSFVHEPEHDQELQQLKEVHQLELRELESRLVLDTEREREVVMQELRELRQRSEVLTEEKNAAVTEYEHTKQILHTLELELGERTEDFVKQYNAMKERAAAAVRELQEQLNEKDTIIKNLESLTKVPEISEQNAQIPTCPEPAAELPEPLEGGYVSVSWDEDNQVTLEKVVTHLHHIKDECKTRPADWARLSFQKLEDLSVVLDSALGEREDITKRMADLESRLSSSLAEKEQLSEQCDALVQNLDALRAAEEQCQTAARELSNTAGQEKAELQKQLHLVVEERDAVRKDMETIEQKLLDAQTRISAVLEQEYSTPVAEVKEETAVLTQQLKEQSEQLIKISSQSGSEQRAAGLGAEVELLQTVAIEPVAGSLQERQAETQCQDVRDSQGTGITAALMVKEDSPDDPGSPETDDLKRFQQKLKILEKESKEKDERMNKIKAVAVKARKELEASKKEASDLRAELDALKAERDRLSDSVKVIIHGAEDYKNKQLCSEREDTMTRMDTLQNNVRQLEAQLLELQRIKSGLERDLETERLLKEQKIKDHQSAVKEAEDLNALLQKQKQQLQQTEQELEQLRKDAQQSTLLDMEMADYERLVKELNLQLSEKDRLIEEQDKLAQTQRDQEQKLSQEIESLKTLVDTGEEKASKMKQLLVKTKKDLADAKKEVTGNCILGTRNACFVCVCVFQIQCSELTADRHRLQEQLKCVNDQQQKALSSYQHQLSSLQEELSSKTAELKSTMSEFEGYKVRVHNVLKQQKTRSSTQSDGEFSKQEREHMEALLEQLHSKLQESQLNLQSSSTELQQLHTEHDMLLERHNKMLQQTVAKEAELRERVLSLHSENAALRSEHSQAVSQLTAQAEALRSCFREQTHHLQEEHRSTVDTLQQQISRLEARLFQLQKEPSRRPQLDRKLTELPLFDLESMAREEGEGMETTETECITAGTPTPTLEQLLTSPDPKQEPFVWQVEPTKEELTQKLSTASRSMEHVNSLLHESEATNAILLEQNNLLKSELRRLERNQEREKSVANLEYLKNVLLQFIFLRSGSEKQALLPVIHTMLQLSPEEKSKLAAIAQGEEEAAGSRASGWTSYLHSWSGIR
uniref:GRIP domain-containing protein n=1 Tax=Astyanax mexicanus TaxID=7994 RepID=W5LLB3_ASTMX